ncbi:MAG: GGDEF domain-containing protein, partial [Deltaproteobacteria bacterium]|nr:GGDEF domain-containing protein [Deltaproteobacteria bacterium]
MSNQSSKNIQGEALDTYNDLMATSYDMAKKLLPFLAKRRIPLIPENYRLFYDYFLAQNPELVSKLNNALKHESLFTPEVTDKLYKYFYDFNPETVSALTKAGEQIGSISQTLETNLEQSLSTADHFQKILADSAQQMEQSEIESSDMRGLVDSLLNETKLALSSQTALADLIETSNRVIATLTAELKDQTRLATIDELTQLYNRRYLAQRFQEITSKMTPEETLTMIIFDLDRFKSINDTWGHAFGDKVLMICAKIIQKMCDDKSLACRYGGEEFVVLCSDRSIKDTIELADAIRLKIAQTEVTIRGNNLPVTISAGVSLYRSGEEEKDFIDRADRALYQAKAKGRNCVVSSEEASQETS